MSDHRKLIFWEIGMIVIVVATYLVSRILGVLPRGASALALISTIVTTVVAVFVETLEHWHETSTETPTRRPYDPYDSYYYGDNYAAICEKDSEPPLPASKGDKIGRAIFSAIIVIGIGLGILALGVGSVGSFIVMSIVVLGIMVMLTTNLVTAWWFDEIEPSIRKTTAYITFFGILASLLLGGVLPETVPGPGVEHVHPIVGTIPGFVAIALLGLLALRKR